MRETLLSATGESEQMGKDYYAILGVPREADEVTLKKVRWLSRIIRRASASQNTY